MPLNKEKAPRFIAKPEAWRAAMAVAAVSGLFSLVVCVLLVANYLQVKAIDPLNNAPLLELRKQLDDASGMDPELVNQIRAMDLLARKAFFTSQAHLRMGGRLLLYGVAVLLISLKLAARWRPRLPAPAGEDNGHWVRVARAKELIAFAAVVLVTVSLLAAYFTPVAIPPAQVAEAPAPAAAVPDWETICQNWPSFRGPGGYGVAYHTNAPTDWDGESGRNIRWKAEVPLPGYNSPVVWGNRLLMSGATEEQREVYCYDTGTGELLWKRALPKFPGTPDKPPKVMEDTGYAAPTMAVHGDLAFAIFANGDLACHDLEGNRRWGFNLGKPENHYGHASSLIAYGNLLFVQYDQSGGGKLLAFDAATGNEAWAVQRKNISWASPACIRTPLGAQLILNSERDVDAYDPKTGALLWSVPCLDGEVAPSPAYADSTIFVANEYATASAIRLDASSGTAQAGVAWEYEDLLPDIASPVGGDGHFYLVTSFGDAVCLDAATGANVWTHEFDEGFSSSPICVGDRIYALDLQGVMHIFKTSPAFALIAAPELGEPAFATPAYLDGRIYVRTDKHVICIGQPDAA